MKQYKCCCSYCINDLYIPGVKENLCFNNSCLISCLAQFEAMLEELARRREECLQLRTLLSARSRELSQLASENYGNNPAIVNEDGELEMAYRTQKDLNRLAF